MESLYPDFKELFESLNSAKVKYLVLGGYAVIYHGYRRATDDLDIWIAVDEENAQKVSAVLQKFAGFPKSQVPPAMFLVPNKIYIFGREPSRVDILTSTAGLTFDDCYARRKTARIENVSVPFISLADLRINKAAAGRNKDLDDLENLPQSSSKKRKRRSK